MNEWKKGDYTLTGSKLSKISWGTKVPHISVILMNPPKFVIGIIPGKIGTVIPKNKLWKWKSKKKTLMKEEEESYQLPT